MNVTQGNLFWNENIQIIKQYPYISKNRKCDVLIIGGGIGGALTAYIQAKQGAQVIVVDKNIIGLGTTIATNGVLEARIDDINNKSIKTMSKEKIDKCNNLYGQAISSIIEIINEIFKDEDCKKYIDKLGLKQTDLLVFSDKVTNKIGMYKTFEKLGKQDDTIEYLEEDPLVNLRTGIIFKNQAVILNPYLLTQLIFIYLSKLTNVEIYENTNILNISSNQDKVECITSNKFKIYSKCVILTNGIHQMEYLKNVELNIHKVFNVVTDKIENLSVQDTNVILKDVGTKNTTIAFTKDKRVIISGECCKQTDKMLNDRYFTYLANGKYKSLYIKLCKLLNVEEIKVRNCFYGLYLETKDTLPIIDEIKDMTNVYCNLSVGRNGIVHSMIGAKLLKDIVKQSHVKDMYMFRENRW